MSVVSKEEYTYMRVLQPSSSISATVTASVAVTKESEAILSRCSSVKPRGECDLIMKSGALLASSSASMASSMVGERVPSPATNAMPSAIITVRDISFAAFFAKLRHIALK